MHIESLRKERLSCAIVIPARGGSVRIPKKSLQMLGDKSLIAWAIVGAQELDCDVYLSTDDAAMKAEGLAWGAEILDRHPDFADDSVTTLDVLANHVKRDGLDYDILAVRQPTSPFLLPETICRCFELAGYANRPVGLVYQDMHKIDMRKTGGIYCVPYDILWDGSYRNYWNWLWVSCSERESLDIDTEKDLTRARNML